MNPACSSQISALFLGWGRDLYHNLAKSLRAKHQVAFSYRHLGVPVTKASHPNDGLGPPPAQPPTKVPAQEGISAEEAPYRSVALKDSSPVPLSEQASRGKK